MNFEFYNQWSWSNQWDLFQVGFYKDRYIFCLNFTIVGFGFDFDWDRGVDK